MLSFFFLLVCYVITIVVADVYPPNKLLPVDTTMKAIMKLDLVQNHIQTVVLYVVRKTRELNS